MTEAQRCAWCGTDPLYVAYHDEEWGRPLHDARGRRTSTQAGLVTAVMLFLNKNAAWADSAYGRNTAAFEQWFRDAMRY